MRKIEEMIQSAGMRAGTAREPERRNPRPWRDLIEVKTLPDWIPWEQRFGIDHEVTAVNSTPFAEPPEEYDRAKALGIGRPERK